MPQTPLNESQLIILVEQVSQMRASQLATQTKLDTLTSLPADMAIIKEQMRTANGRLRSIEVWKERTFGAMALMGVLMGSGIIGILVALFGGQ